MSDLMNLPVLQGASVLAVPAEFREFGDKHGVGEIILAAGPALRQSLRSGQNVIVNLRGTFWTALIDPPFCADTYFEAIVLRFLHEVGHHVCNHKPDVGYSSDGVLVKPVQHPLEAQEGEAWAFAFDLRKNHKKEFDVLVSSAKKHLSPFPFGSVDWELSAPAQFKRYRNADLKTYRFQLYKWVVSEFGKYMTKRYNIETI